MWRYQTKIKDSEMLVKLTNLMKSFLELNDLNYDYMYVYLDKKPVNAVLSIDFKKSNRTINYKVGSKVTVILKQRFVYIDVEEEEDV